MQHFSKQQLTTWTPTTTFKSLKYSAQLPFSKLNHLSTKPYIECITNKSSWTSAHAVASQLTSLLSTSTEQVISWEDCGTTCRRKPPSRPALPQCAGSGCTSQDARCGMALQSWSGRRMRQVEVEARMRLRFTTVCRHSNLSSTQTDHQIGNERVLSLATAMRHHDTPPCLLRHRARLDRLGDRSNLVDLEKECVARFLVDCILHSLWVCDEKIVTERTGSTCLQQQQQ